MNGVGYKRRRNNEVIPHFRPTDTHIAGLCTELLRLSYTSEQRRACVARGLLAIQTRALGARMSSTEPTYDAIVVGSGAAGSWAAKELTEGGLQVVLLEAGRNLDLSRDFPADATVGAAGMMGRARRPCTAS